MKAHSRLAARPARLRADERRKVLGQLMKIMAGLDPARLPRAFGKNGGRR